MKLAFYTALAVKEVSFFVQKYVERFTSSGKKKGSQAVISLFFLCSQS